MADPGTSEPAQARARRRSEGLIPSVRPRGVERTFGWFGRCRRLSKDFEGSAATELA
ncbi:hypothetical protein FJV43_25000 [Bradyrhizobium sp. I71]|nr:hypothetical protein FJV43_25000 [Bradyrhizobium sp. I71]